MEMLRLAVCDDDEFVVEQIESYIEKLKQKPSLYNVIMIAQYLKADLPEIIKKYYN